MGQIKDY